MMMVMMMIMTVMKIITRMSRMMMMKMMRNLVMVSPAKEVVKKSNQLAGSLVT